MPFLPPNQQRQSTDGKESRSKACINDDHSCCCYVERVTIKVCFQRINRTFSSRTGVCELQCERIALRTEAETPSLRFVVELSATNQVEATEFERSWALTVLISLRPISTKYSHVSIFYVGLLIVRLCFMSDFDWLWIVLIYLAVGLV